jgi:manganese/zinc/iron transport system permease protein
MVNLIFVIVFFKELRLTSFDTFFADTVGFASRSIHYILMTFVAITAVASFESVGNILVVAMFIVPPAAARLLTDRLAVMILVSALLGATSAVLGHWSAVVLPRMVGFSSTSTAGMIAVMSGVLFTAAVIFSPKQGLLPRYIRGLRLEMSILRDDVLAFLFRLQERAPDTYASHGQISSSLRANPLLVRFILTRERHRGHLVFGETGFRLSSTGNQSAVNLVRAHRLWEQYLVDQTGMNSDRIHDHAERFEHMSDKQIRDDLERETQYPKSDPHGSPIPKESE